jgi:hypothetical protein
MPEFIADTDGTVSGKEWDDLSPFVQGYIEAMLFTSVADGVSMVDWNDPENREADREGTLGGSIPGDSGFGDIHPTSLQRAIEECETFQAKASDLLSLAYQRDYNETQAGRDFWFTRCGHGVGYWDRNQLEADDLGRKLSDLCGCPSEFAEVNATFGEAADGAESPTGYGFVFVE